MTDHDLQERADRLVHNNVNCCLSSLVATLAYGTNISYLGEPDKSLRDLCEQAYELARPVDDYEEAARQGGLALNPDDAKLITWEGVCVAHDLDPYEREVFEHWSVSRWLADKLIAHGERVDTDFAGLNVWARTTTGQAINMDPVIQKIVREL